MKRFAKSFAAVTRPGWFALHRSKFRETGPARKPRLYVDVSVILKHDAATGIQRVVRAIWSGLAETDHEGWDVVPVYAGLTHGYCFANADFFERRQSRSGGPVGVRPGDRFLGLDLTAHYLPHCVQQLDAWRGAGATVHIVVYDLLPLTQAGWFNATTRQNFARWFDVVEHHADQALCISDAVRRNVLARLTAGSGPAVGRLYLSGDIAASRPSTGVSANVSQVLDQARTRPTVIMIGTVEPRKGYNPALDAFDRLWLDHSVDAPDLVIIGKPGWKTEHLQQRIRRHPELGCRLHWLEDATDEALALFYQACRGILFASRAEGFGLPLAEAAAHRRWILARDLPVFREQDLSNVLYFNGDEADALSRRIMTLVETAGRGDPPLRPLVSWSDSIDRLMHELRIHHASGDVGSNALSLAS